MTLESFALATRPRIEMEDRAISVAVSIASLVSDALQQPSALEMPRMCPGAGLCLSQSTLLPTILVDGDVYQSFGPSPEEPVPIARLPQLYSLQVQIEALLGGPRPYLNTLHALFVRDGGLHSKPGTGISCSMRGSVGPHVTWGTSKQGFLTAGHVARTANADVFDGSGAKLGTVVWSNDPALKPTTTADIDSALVEFASKGLASVGRTTAIVGAGDVLTVASNTRQSKVFGYFKHVTLGGAQACYSDCLATEQLISSRGDSGALVEMNGDVAGIVIGGFKRRDMTLVQSIDYQMTEVRHRSKCVISL